MDNRETGMTGIAETADADSRKIRKETATSNPALTGVSNEERYQLIAEAAYFRAEQRSFTPGCEFEDWLMAEAEIKMRRAGSSMDWLLESFLGLPH